MIMQLCELGDTVALPITCFYHLGNWMSLVAAEAEACRLLMCSDYIDISLVVAGVL